MKPKIPYLRQTMNEVLRRFTGVPHIDFFPDGPILERQAWPPKIDAFGRILLDYVQQNRWLQYEYEEYWEWMHESY